MSAGTHQACLDGWRGLAILLLLVGHFAPVPGINLGTLGVNFFFVLSGMLMARLLFIQKVALPHFYRRRIARVLPAHLCFIGLVLMAWLLLGRPIDASETAAAALFVNNYLGAEPGRNLMPFGHIWSLSVEEHSYVLLSLFALATRRLWRSPSLLLGLACALSAMMSIWYWHRYAGPSLSFDKLLHTEVAGYGIFVSALICVLTHQRGMRPLRAPVLLALLAIALVSHWWSVPDPVRNIVGIGALALAVNLLPSASPAIQHALSASWLRSLGLWSFSLYLWQQPFYLAYRHGVMPLAVALGCTLALSLLSYRLVEGPARRYLNTNWNPQPKGQLLPREGTPS